MVQVQSSWFPLYDRNPQRFVILISALCHTEFWNNPFHFHFVI